MESYGFLYEPENEAEVCILFGLLMPYVIDELNCLGFSATCCYFEEFTGDYPDAIIQINDNTKIRAEFELYSHNFKEHKHDPKACDLIICWKHNWPDCPVKVLELQKIIEEKAANLILKRVPKHQVRVWSLNEFLEQAKKELNHVDFQEVKSFIEALATIKDVEIKPGRGKEACINVYFRRYGIAPITIDCKGKASITYYNVNVKPPEILLPEHKVAKIRKILKEPKKMWHYIKAENIKDLMCKLRNVVSELTKDY